MRVVVPYDGSEQAAEALDHAVSHHADDDVVLLRVLDFVDAGYDAPPEAALPGYWEDWYEQAESEAEAELEAAAADHDREFELETVVGRPARAIVEYVDENDIDHVVMGSHGRDGITRVLLGSVAEAVVRRSPVPVTVVR
ncbi:UspA domain protein [Natronomonas pharaonis DSM 2160]|uniref:UspA domain protein n=1 Tax=Natronomonas pharaonis (strain ATCC 35678 / DSM 2160 / CIP 103997 / JCM 8858 / NBRC 14720 / NCIMB 2260 / Gabara) TaxID=348780 RepID=A0A1U7EWH4_NATPD|nr:universal stress protein [Natronomonas pharaonis]CAI49440.1 UspA domain protein [Natronomonas pharaonis DSM 2160]